MYGRRGRIGLRKLGVREVQPGLGSLFDKVFAAMEPSEQAAEPQRARR